MTLWVLVIAGVSALNLSSACRHDPPTNISPENRSELDLGANASSNVEVVAETETEPTAFQDPTSNDPIGLENVVAAEDLGVHITNSDGLEELTWKALTDVEFEDVYVEELDAYYWKPTFGENVKAMEGRDVYITGYIIPVDYDENFYVLSRYPFANCFFCGGAGPESVVDLRFKDENRVYQTDERLTFRGSLSLNANDVYQMNYILIDAVEYE